MSNLTKSVAVLVVAATVVGSSFAQAPDERFTAEERVTAVDMIVGLGKPGTKPRWPEAEDFTARAAGEELQVVAVSTEEVWDVRVWFDPVLTGKETLRWAADLLAPQSESWTGLGNVSVVVADPEPRRLVEPTRDPGRLAAGFADLALFPSGRDELRTMRHETLEAGDAETVARSVRAEVELVQQRSDVLLRWLVEEPVGGAGRVLILVAEGYDEDPAAFYRTAGLDPPASGDVLRGDAQRLAETVAGYGWTTVVLTPDPASSLRPRGVRIGKWFLSGKGIWFQERKKPERARAFVDLGESLLGQDALVDAEDAFDQALHHFADDPKTVEGQARALAGLAEVYRRLGDLRQSREALASAAELDPDRGQGLQAVGAELQARLDPLRTLAADTAGSLVMSSRGLEDARIDLERRFRVTLQLAGDPRGELLPIELTHGGGQALRCAGWVRSGTPPRVAEARLRALLEGAPADGGLDVSLGVEEGGARLKATLDDGEAAILRVSWLVGGPDVVPRFLHRMLEAEEGRVEDVLEVVEDSETWIGALLEDLGSGAWGVAVSEKGGAP